MTELTCVEVSIALDDFQQRMQQMTIGECSDFLLFRHLPQMRKLVDLEDLKLYLIAEGALTDNDMAKLEILPPHNTPDKVFQTLALLMRQKGSRGLQKFMTALRRSVSSGNQPGHKELLQILEEGLETTHLLSSDQKGLECQCIKQTCISHVSLQRFRNPIQPTAILTLVTIGFGIMQFLIGAGGLSGVEWFECPIKGGALIQLFNITNGMLLCSLGLDQYMQKLSQCYNSEGHVPSYQMSRQVFKCIAVLDLLLFIGMAVVTVLYWFVWPELNTCSATTFYSGFVIVAVILVVITGVAAALILFALYILMLSLWFAVKDIGTSVL